MRQSEWCIWGEYMLNAHLLLRPQGKETDTRDLDDLETHTGNITLGLTTATETRNKDFIVLIDEVQATIVLSQTRSARSDLLACLDRAQPCYDRTMQNRYQV